MEEETWETGDMSLAVFLSIAAEQPFDAFWRTRGRRGSCFWKFRDSELLRSRVFEYENGKALVDPREYSRAYAAMKREMFELKEAS